MRTQVIYLAGNMSGLSFDECTKWREETKQRLESIIQPCGTPLYKCLSPCRGKNNLKNSGILPKVDNGKGWGEFILQRDKYDVLRSDVIIFNYLHAHKTGSSIGSCFEQAFAYISDKPIFSIIVLDRNSGNPTDHEFIRRTASLIVPSLEEAIDYLENILNA